MTQATRARPLDLDAAETAIMNLIDALQAHRRSLLMLVDAFGEAPSWQRRLDLVDAMLEATPGYCHDPAWVRSILRMRNRDGLLFGDLRAAGATGLFVPSFDLPGIRKWVRLSAEMQERRRREQDVEDASATTPYSDHPRAGSQ
jgi:hypothetical protein